MILQRTLKTSISVAGVGLHSGQKVTLGLRPAPVNTGVVFRRLDIKPVIEIPARADLVFDTRLSTGLEKNGIKISTIEHLMSAIFGLGLDNIFVDLDGAEVPIMDGSAGTFVFLLQSAGIVKQHVVKKFIQILKSVEVRNGDKWARLDPYVGRQFSMIIDFPHPVFKNVPQHVIFELGEEEYVRNLSRARTFGFMQEVEMMREQDLALGGSLDNAIVMDEYRVLNMGGLRFEDEFVKHKILDAVGDIALLGYATIGSFSGYKTGHALNNKLVRAVLQDTEAWKLVTDHAFTKSQTFERGPSITSTI